MKTMYLHDNENRQEVTNPRQRMASLEIARLTGKPHNDVMKAIRKMEQAWENVCGGKFSLTSRLVEQPNGGTREVPCYLLTKAETLFVATKFHDEARARLVLRWEELERQERQRQMTKIGLPRTLIDLSGSRGSQATVVVLLADGRMLPLPEWRPWHGPVRRLVCRTAHGIVREGTDDYTLYVRIPKTIPEVLDTTPQEVLDAEVAGLLKLMNLNS